MESKYVRRLIGLWKRPDVEKSKQRQGQPKDPHLVFIHGLGGDADGTWNNFSSLCLSDNDLQHVGIDYYEYPTSLMRRAWSRKSPRIQQIAQGLRTVLDIHCSKKEDLTLVAHSLGGLVLRKYVVEEVKAGRKPFGNRFVLYSTPNSGAAIANFAREISWAHEHLSQLSVNSDFVEALNEDWSRLEIEKNYDFHYVAGGLDKVVAPESAGPSFARRPTYTIIDKDHRSIIRPNGYTDDAYLLLKKIVWSVGSGGISASANALATPLFDIYQPAHEKYFLEREIDTNLATHSETTHFWITGESGSGKTCSARRYFFKSLSATKIYQITLGAYVVHRVEDVMRAFALEIASLSEVDRDLASETSLAQYIALIRRDLYAMSKIRPIALLIEEIPMIDDKMMIDFVKIVAKLVVALDTDTDVDHRPILCFTSISDPMRNLPAGLSKLRERMLFLRADPWRFEDLIALVQIIDDCAPVPLFEDEKVQIASTMPRTPRLVKGVYRKLFTLNNRSKSVLDIINQTSSEQV